MDSVPTLADLGDPPRTGTALAVLGHPIRHSISPAMHNAALAAMARSRPEFASWSYGRFDVPPADLPTALSRLHALGYRGLNLTVPHKVLAFGSMTEIDPAARPIGAVNTLRWSPQGWHGFNTDGYGLATAIGETLGLTLQGTHVVLLGAGGAARGAAVECLQRGCASLWIANRTQENLDTLLSVLRPLAGAIPLHGFPPDRLPGGLPTGSLVVNATSAGLKPQDPPPIDLATIPSPAGVYDMIYNPPVTPLLAQAARLGLPHANGLSMLIHQGARALEIWSGASVPVAAMRQAAEQALGRTHP
ncbi:MAG: shikimate dehydrogenase [Opitutaceae bacterium]